MTLPLLVALLTIVLLGITVLVLIRRLGTDNHVLPVTTEWLSELSTERYRPMLRLLQQTDFEFLRAQKGHSLEMADRVRRERVEVLLGYLRMLEMDFDRVSTALRLILAHSECDRPELASLLLRRRLLFACALTGVRCRLLLFRLGFPAVDVSSLIQMFDGLRRELRSLVPASSPVAA